MRKVHIFFLFCFLSGMLFLASCRKEGSKPDEAEQSELTQETEPAVTDYAKYLVSKIYDYHGNTIATYDYSEGRLTRRNFKDPGTGYTSSLIFAYENGKISQIAYKDDNFPEYNHEKHYTYDVQGRMIKIETFKKEVFMNKICIHYNGQGFADHLFVDENEPMNGYTYDTKGNIRSTSLTGVDELSGVKTDYVYNFKFDGHKKPSFGLDYLLGTDLIPRMGSNGVWERSLSASNMTSDQNSGTTYSYKYNATAYPVSITTVWKGITTTEPMKMTFEYIPAN